jgi:phospholipid transport system substrate-binding protein
MQNRTTLATTAVALLLIASGASAQSGSAAAYVQRLNAQVDALMAHPPATDALRTTRDARVGAIIEQILDYDAFARGTLGSEWAPRTADERHEFQVLLSQSIRQSYVRNLERIRDYQITYVSEEPTADGVIVRTRAQSRASRREPPTRIDYAMHRVGGEWRVYDVSTEGVSLVVGQGARMRSVIAQHGWAELMNRLRENVAGAAS